MMEIVIVTEIVSKRAGNRSFLEPIQLYNTTYSIYATEKKYTNHYKHDIILIYVKYIERAMKRVALTVFHINPFERKSNGKRNQNKEIYNTDCTYRPVGSDRPHCCHCSCDAIQQPGTQTREAAGAGG